MQINELARAKINLCLHVTGKRSDGYHLLDSVVVFADMGDQISAKPANGFSLTIEGPFANQLTADADNLVLRAAKYYQKQCPGAEIILTKNLPVASGIGGGSADAAATLRAISALHDLELPSDQGLALGADVPVCLSSDGCRMQGIGEQITPFPELPPMAAILVCPDVSVKTPDVFKTLVNRNNTALGALPVVPISRNKMMEFISSQRNDLEEPAISIAPAINDCLQMISENGASLARMSGSGATCFGLFKSDTDARKAAKIISNQKPNWWVKDCQLGA